MNAVYGNDRRLLRGTDTLLILLDIGASAVCVYGFALRT
jgi:hypothetical protein